MGDCCCDKQTRVHCGNCLPCRRGDPCRYRVRSIKPSAKKAEPGTHPRSWHGGTACGACASEPEAEVKP